METMSDFEVRIEHPSEVFGKIDCLIDACVSFVVSVEGKSGYSLVSIGICGPEGEHMYDRSFVLDNVDSVSEAIFEEADLSCDASANSYVLTKEVCDVGGALVHHIILDNIAD